MQILGIVSNYRKPAANWASGAAGTRRIATEGEGQGASPLLVPRADRAVLICHSTAEPESRPCRSGASSAASTRHTGPS